MRSLNAARSKVTASQYLRHHMMMRANYSNYLHRNNKLFQQFIVDYYCKIESQRVRFHANNQNRLRADLCRGVQDSIRNNDVENSGRTVILPATFTGGDRYMHSNYLDAMALVRQFGKPDFFCYCNM